MKIAFVLLCAFASLVSTAQSVGQEISTPEVGWTITIPKDAKFLTQYELDTLNRKTISAVNSAYGNGDSIFKGVTQILAIRQGRWNNLASTLNLYDSTIFPTWQESYAASKLLIIDLMNKQGSQIKIVDTASSIEVIDGLTFQRFYLKTFYPASNFTLYTYWYYRKHGKYDFSITTSFGDIEVGKDLLSVIHGSRFKH
jgi:hypothetical protein